MTNILLTGRPGIGKTTLVEKVINTIGKEKFGGFLTQEIRKDGKRVGFSIKTLEGSYGILAHIDFKSSLTVGAYKVNLKALDEIGVKAVEKAMREGKIVVIDEIGKMELYSNSFKEVVLRALDYGKLIATMTLSPHTFTSVIKRRRDVEIVEITAENRDRVVGELERKVKLYFYTHG